MRGARETREGAKTVVITVKVPRIWVEMMDRLVERGVYMSRSDLIRDAIKDKLFREGLSRLMERTDIDTPRRSGSNVNIKVVDIERG